MIAFLGAVDQEVSGLRRRLRNRTSQKEAGRTVYRGQLGGQDVLVATMGIGRWPAELAAQRILDRYKVAALICLGFSGATQADLKAADLVLCRRIHRARPVGLQKLSLEETLECPPELLEAARRAAQAAGVPWREGEGLSLIRVVTQARAKGWIGRALPVQVVDMESFWVGRLAAEKGVPFLAARAVLDAMEEDLPDFNPLLDARGRWRVGRAVGYFLTHPHRLPGLAALALKARRARGSLTRFALALAEQGGKD